MPNLLIGLFVVVVSVGPIEESPRGQYEALVNEFDTAYKVAIDAVTKAKNDEERVKASVERPRSPRRPDLDRVEMHIWPPKREGVGHSRP